MASPACLSSNVGYVEERGVCMLLRKAALACLVLAMRIDLSICLTHDETSSRKVPRESVEISLIALS
jgi:hypothetical protein